MLTYRLLSVICASSIEYKLHELKDRMLRKCLAHKRLKKCCCMKSEQMVMGRTVMSVSIDNYDRNKALGKQTATENSKSEFVKSFLWPKLYTEHLDFLFFLLPSFQKNSLCCCCWFVVVVAVVRRWWWTAVAQLGPWTLLTLDTEAATSKTQ